MANTVKSFVALSLLLVVVSTVSPKRKDSKLSPKERMVNPAMDTINKNISALWHEVELLQQPVHIHIHGEGEVMKGHGQPPYSHGVGKHRHGPDDDDDDDDDKKKKDKEGGRRDEDHRHHGHDHRMGPGGMEGPRHGHDHHDEGTHHDRHPTHVHIHLHTGEPKHRPPEKLPQDYVNARCDVVANSALSKSEQQNIQGAIYFRQKPFQEMEVLINVTGIKVKHDGKEASNHQHLHGLHIHEFADMSQGCNSMGGHFNPAGVVHGAPDSSHRHVGDWGNLEVNEQGVGFSRFNDTIAALLGFHTILGRGLVIHAAADDLGQGGTEASLKTGNAGGRIACCVIVATAAAPDVWD